MSRFVAAVLIALSILVPSGAGADTAAPSRTVTIDNFVFTPKELKIPVGTRVTWINRDDIPHTIVSAGGGANFKSPPLDTDGQFSVVFDHPGTYKYFCSIHPMMTATIVVQ